jgi:hypothetical protein
LLTPLKCHVHVTLDWPLRSSKLKIGRLLKVITIVANNIK